MTPVSASTGSSNWLPLPEVKAEVETKTMVAAEAAPLDQVSEMNKRMG